MVQRIHLSVVLLLGAAVCLAACQGQQPLTAENTIATLVAATQTAAPPPPVVTEAEAAVEEPDAVPVSSYTDPELGFEFDIPESWVISHQETQSRGRYIQFSNPGSGEERTLLQVTVYLWDPRGDLDAYLAQRFAAWEASGIAAEIEETITLQDGNQGVLISIQGTDGAQAKLFYAVVDGSYLEISSDQDYDSLRSVISSLWLGE